jgi:hypothetical protein
MAPSTRAIMPAICRDRKWLIRRQPDPDNTCGYDAPPSYGPVPVWQVSSCDTLSQCRCILLQHCLRCHHERDFAHPSRYVVEIVGNIGADIVSPG